MRVVPVSFFLYLCVSLLPGTFAMSAVVAFALVRCSVCLSWKLEGIEATLPTLQLRAATLPGIRTQVSWFPTQPNLWTLAHPFALAIPQQLPAGHITWHVDHVHQAFIADENLCVKVLCWINSISAWERGTEASLSVQLWDLVVATGWEKAVPLWFVGNTCIDLRELPHDLRGLLKGWEILGTQFYQHSQYPCGTERAAWYYRKITRYEPRMRGVSVCCDACFPSEEEYPWCVCILLSVGKPQFYLFFLIKQFLCSVWGSDSQLQDQGSPALQTEPAPWRASVLKSEVAFRGLSQSKESWMIGSIVAVMKGSRVPCPCLSSSSSDCPCIHPSFVQFCSGPAECGPQYRKKTSLVLAVF